MRGAGTSKRSLLANKSVLVLGEEMLVAIGLQLLFVRFCKIGGVAPQFFLIWILYLGWYNNPVPAMIGGFLTGLLYDWMVQGRLGWSSLLLVSIAYVNSFLPSRTFRARILNAVVFSIFYFVFLAYAPSSGFLWEKSVVAKYSLLFAAYNCLFVVLVEWYLKTRRWNEKSFSRTW